MPDITFGRDGKVVFPTKYHGEVTLSEKKWGIICGEPERTYYRFNGDKIATTLINPDHVRRSQSYPKQFLYYKRFASIMIDSSNEIRNANGIWFTAIIDEETQRLCTVYPVEKPKVGKEFKPKPSK